MKWTFALAFVAPFSIYICTTSIVALAKGVPTCDDPLKSYYNGSTCLDQCFRSPETCPLSDMKYGCYCVPNEACRNREGKCVYITRNAG